MAAAGAALDRMAAPGGSFPRDDQPHALLLTLTLEGGKQPDEMLCARGRGDVQPEARQGTGSA